jgi:hypothetical protein
VTTVATFETKGTSLQVPDTVLASGTSYFVVITALAIPGYDGTVAPFLEKLPSATAALVSAQFTP